MLRGVLQVTPRAGRDHRRPKCLRSFCTVRAPGGGTTFWCAVREVSGIYSCASAFSRDAPFFPLTYSVVVDLARFFT